jgi:hypothetical protein
MNHALLFETTNDLSLEQVESLVREKLGPQWSVEKLGKWVPHYKATRSEDITVKEAWSSAHQLAGEEFRYIEPNIPHEPEMTAMGSFFQCDENHKQGTERPDWAIDQIKVKQAWTLRPPQTTGRQLGEGIRVGLPDTGFTVHKEIWNTHLLVNEGWNYGENNSNARDTGEGANKGHGTSTASLIFSDRSGVVQGVAPQAYVVPIRVGGMVLVDGEKLIRAIDYAIDKGCLVISMSLGTLHNPQAIDRALQAAVENGVIPVGAAAQFAGIKYDVWPASSAWCISCTGTNILENPWYKSLKSQFVDIAAPAESVTVADAKLYSNEQDTSTGRYCGTSFATALVAGCAAVWYAYWSPQYLHQQFGKQKIFAMYMNTLRKYGTYTPRNWNSRDFGPGIMNLHAHLQQRAGASALVEGAEAEGATEIEGGEDADQFMASHLEQYPSTAMDYLLATLPEERREEVREYLSSRAGNSDPYRESLLRELRYHVRSNEAFAEQLAGISSFRAAGEAAFPPEASEQLTQFLKQ